MKITIGDREIIHTDATLVKPMDKGADALIVSFDWVPGEDTEIDALVQPYAYPDFTVEINGELRASGRIYIVEPSLAKTRSEITLTGFSYTKDLIDSTAKPPYEFNNKNLLDISNQLCLPFGIQALQENVKTEVNEIFEKNITIQNQQRIFSFLQNLSRQKGILASSDVNGNLLYLKTTNDLTPVANLTEGDLGTSLATGQRFSAIFDGTKRFNSYLATEESTLSYFKPITAVSIDDAIKIPRFTTTTADEITQGGMQSAADFFRNKTAANADSRQFPVPSFFSSAEGPVNSRGIHTQAKIWQENTVVTVTSPTIFVPDGFDYLIRSVEYISNESGETAVLSLVDPRFFTKQDINKDSKITKFQDFRLV